MHITPSTGADLEKKYLYLELSLKLGANVRLPKVLGKVSSSSI